MLKDIDSSAILAVSDLARARDFYHDKLGLDLSQDNASVLSFKTGKTTLHVYVSDFAGTNKANAVVWNAGGDFDTVADQLREQGVTFEEYPDLGMEIERGVHRAGGFKGVWFKDPDGNVLHVTNM